MFKESLGVHSICWHFLRKIFLINLLYINCLVFKVGHNFQVFLGYYKSNSNNRKLIMCEIWSKLTINIPVRLWRRSGVLVANFEHDSHVNLVFPLLTFKCRVGFPISTFILFYFKITRYFNEKHHIEIFFSILSHDLVFSLQLFILDV